MDVSCATLIFAKSTKRFLLVHPTNSPFWERKGVPSKIWGLPKGINEGHETYLETAVRELEEETGIKADSDYMFDIGLFDYKDDKQLYIFLYIMDSQVKNLHCDSTFTDTDGIDKPEIDKYRYVTAEEVGTYMNTKMYKSVGVIIKNFLSLAKN